MANGSTGITPPPHHLPTPLMLCCTYSRVRYIVGDTVVSCRITYPLCSSSVCADARAAYRPRSHAYCAVPSVRTVSKHHAVSLVSPPSADVCKRTAPDGSGTDAEGLRKAREEERTSPGGEVADRRGAGPEPSLLLFFTRSLLRRGENYG